VANTTLVLFYPWERPGVQCGRGAGLDSMVSLALYRIIPLDCPANSDSLY